MAYDDETGWAWATGPQNAAPPRRWLLLLALLGVAALAAGLVLQTTRVERLSAALSDAHATATAEAHALATARSAAVATATAAAYVRRRAPAPLALPPAVARPACTAVARAQAVVRVVLGGVKGAGAVADAAARALRDACAATIHGH